MNEMTKTVQLGVGALVLAALAFVTAPSPAAPDAFSDLGEPFFPEFTDPNTARTLEVVEFDEDTAAARPFKVTNQDGIWTIPSHNDYPADGADRLARTAAGVIGITRDDFRSDNVADHAALGALDPVDETETSFQGRGTRVSLKGENDRVLADFIIGKELEDRPGLRFVRLPDEKRVYAARMDVDISTRFADWIEQDLLQVDRTDIERVVLHDYSIDERTLRVNERDVVTLDKVDGTWTGDDQIPADREVDTTKVNQLLSAVDGLQIVGVRPKPAGLSQGLTRTEDGLAITQSDVVSLQSRGYYFTREGQLRSNEGELQVRTNDGILYTLRFGEVLYGSGEAISAGSDANDDEASGPGENRYLFITAEFEADRFPAPPTPENTAFQTTEEADWSDADHTNKALQDANDEWAQTIADGEERIAAFTTRFGPWYFVISADSFDKLHLQRDDVTKEKEEATSGESS